MTKFANYFANNKLLPVLAMKNYNYKIFFTNCKYLPYIHWIFIYTGLLKELWGFIFPYIPTGKLVNGNTIFKADINKGNLSTTM